MPLGLLLSIIGNLGDFGVRSVRVLSRGPRTPAASFLFMVGTFSSKSAMGLDSKLTVLICDFSIVFVQLYSDVR